MIGGEGVILGVEFRWLCKIKGLIGQVEVNAYFIILIIQIFGSDLDFSTDKEKFLFFYFLYEINLKVMEETENFKKIFITCIFEQKNVFEIRRKNY